MAQFNQERQRLRSSGVIPVHFHAVIYEVQGTEDQLHALDAKALAGKATADETLLGTLQAAGKTRVLYRFDQPLNLFSGRISFGTQEPIPRAMRATTNGLVADLISYLTMGAVLQLSAGIPASNGVPAVADLDVRLSGFAPGDVVAGENGGAAGNGPMPRVLALTNEAQLEFGHAMVLTGESSRTVNGTAVTPTLYVVRYVFDKAGQGDDRETSVPSVGAAALAAGFAATNVPARFQSTVYELNAFPFRVDTLNATTLAEHAATEEDLLKTLNENGKARILHHIDNPVNACSDRIQISTNEMVPSYTMAGANGQLRFSSNGMRSGIVVDFSAQTIPKGTPGEGPVVTTAVRMSCLAPSEIDLAPGVPAIAPRTLATENTERLQFNQPRVLIMAGSTYAREQNAPVVYIIRYMFTPP